MTKLAESPVTDKAFRNELLQASVVLPTYGRRASLLRVLHALSKQSIDAGSFEVIVICDGDVDSSVQACRELAPTLPYELRVIEQPNQGPAAARNRGVAEARADLIIFIDDDVVPDDGLVATHVRAQKGQDSQVTIGPLLPPPDVRLSLWCAWEEETLCRQYDDMAAGRWKATYRQFYTGNASVRKHHIVEAGGFNAAFRRAEDVELALRMHHHGVHFTFLPQARGWHYVWRSLESWMRIPVAYGAADVAMADAGYPRMLNIIATEYRRRNIVIRLLTQLCAGRPLATQIVVALLGALLKLADRARVRPLGRITCSLIFSLRYYDGIARALGGRRALEETLRKGAV